MEVKSQQKGARILGIKYCLGPLSETNEDLLAEHPEWDMTAIEKVTGVRTRRLVGPNQTASDLAVEAGEKLLAATGTERGKVDALIFCTQSPDYLLPTTACILQDRLKLSTSIIAFDVNLACSGYVYGLAISVSLIKSGLARTVLLLTGDTYSKFISRDNRTCRPIFGDAAAATLIEGVEGDDLIGPFEFGTDGRGKDKLILPSSGVRCSPGRQDPLNLVMDGGAVLMFTMSAVPRAVDALLKKAGVSKEDVDLYIFHQASKKVLDNLERILAIPSEKSFRCYSEIGNTVSASIPIALHEASLQDRLRSGQRVMLVGFGVGYSWGACLAVWEGERR